MSSPPLSPHQPPSPLDHPVREWPRPLAFVLSGGGAFGSGQVGMLAALARRGVRPDLVVGSSIGALHGAVLAARPDDAVELLTAFWVGASRRTVFGGRADVARCLLQRRSLATFDRLGPLLDQALGAKGFADLDIPFAAVATDGLTGQPALLCRGDLRAALAASAAVPGVFPAVTIDGRPYVDGGVSANVPVHQALAFGAASALVLDVTPPLAATAVPAGVVKGLLHSVSLMLRNQRSDATEHLAGRLPVAVLPSPTPPDMGSFNFTHTARLIADAEEAAAAALDAWEPAPVGS